MGRCMANIDYGATSYTYADYVQEHLQAQAVMEYRRAQNRAEYKQWKWNQVQWTTQTIDPQPEPKRTGMNYSTAVFLINNNVRAMKGIYEEGGNAGTFKTLDATIKKDDLVVVPSGTRHKMTIFKITEVDVDVDMDSPTNVDWVVGKVDQAGYDKLVAEEADAVSKIKSAEMRKKRSDLAENLLKDSIETIRALPIATMGDTPAA